MFGARARRAVDRAREQVAALVGAEPDEILFTSGGTEANNLAIRGVAAAFPDRRHVITSRIEHPATRAPCRALEERGVRIDWLGVDEFGRIDAARVDGALGPDTALVTIMHANNETGTLQPIREITRAARARDVLVHTDAAQSAGKIPVNELGVDLLSIAGHKLNAPKGVGALYVRRGTPLVPFMLGASHERGLRPGTENVASIVGLGVAADLARQRLEAHAARMRTLTLNLLSRLSERIAGLSLAGHRDERLPNTLNLLFPGVRGSAVLVHAPEIAASTGSACHAGEESASAVLTAMGIEPTRALGAVRISLGVTTRDEDVERAAGLLTAAFTRACEARVP